jgi:hypothetical protein
MATVDTFRWPPLNADPPLPQWLDKSVLAKQFRGPFLTSPLAPRG